MIMHAELEEVGASLDAHLDTVDELLTLSLQPKKEGLGGVDKYLIHKLAQSTPLDIKSALARLCLGMRNSIKVGVFLEYLNCGTSCSSWCIVPSAGVQLA